MKNINYSHISYFHSLVIIFILSIHHLLNAQNSINPKYSEVNKLTNNWSVQFMYSQSPISTSARDVVVSLKKNLSSNSALRASVTFIGFFVNEKNTSSFLKYYSGWVGENLQAKYKGNDFTIAYIFYPFKKQAIHFYGGTGFVYSKYDENFNQQILYTNYRLTGQNETVTQISESKTREGGILGLIGVEWFLFKHLSFIGEYDASFVYGKNSVKNLTSNTFNMNPEPFNKSSSFYEFRSRGFRIGFSVYF